nr:MAG TPA: hypothetical protein [Bacteriophage sp.]
MYYHYLYNIHYNTKFLMDLSKHTIYLQDNAY